MTLNSKVLIMLVGLSASHFVLADDSAIDKVYHPYVQPLEREIEWRMLDSNEQQKYQLAIGTSLTDRLFVEAYLVSTRTDLEQLDVEAYELEAKYQLTEQGEYAMDWAVLTELEKQRHQDNWELSTALIVEKEWADWSATANMWLIYEWGDTIDNELESALALQARYRYSRFFEPAIELYSGQDTLALGPVAMGNVKFSGRKQLHWEAGVIVGLDTKTPDTTLRFLTEYEF